MALKDTPTTLNVLANDFDPNCQALHIGATPANTTNGGTVAISGDNLVYTPAAGFTGMDIFQYPVLDASGKQNTGNVFVDVQDYAPAVSTTGAVSGLQVRYYYVPPLDGSLGSMPAFSNPFKVETVPALLFPTTTGTVACSMMIRIWSRVWRPRLEPIGEPRGMTVAVPTSCSRLASTGSALI